MMNPNSRKLKGDAHKSRFKPEFMALPAVTPVCDCCTQKSQETTHRNKAERMKSIPKLKSKDGGTPDSKHKNYMYQ